MIRTDVELQATIERARFQAQLAHMRHAETNVTAFHASAGGFIAELDRMQLEVRDYLSLHPSELQPTA